MEGLYWKSKDEKRRVIYEFYNDWKFKYKKQTLAGILKINLKTLLRYIKICENNFNYNIKCHGMHSYCHQFVIFHNTRKGKINGYRRAALAFKNYSLTKGWTALANIDVTVKQMRLIMKDHFLHGKNRTGLPYKKEKRCSNLWTEDMDLINGKFKYINQLAISLDIKYIKTQEGFLYFNWVKDMISGAIIGEEYGTEMTYEKLVKPSLEQAINFYKQKLINIDQLIIHTDNGKQYYHKNLIDYARQNNFKLSKNKPYKLGHNALSENTFYHLAVEWLPNDNYSTINEAVNDIKDYTQFYNYERIHSKWNAPPLKIF